MRNRLVIAWLGLVGCLVGSAYGQGIVYVNGTTGSDAWDGRCEVWDGGTCGPKATIQAGINTAVAGDEVRLADGVYTGVGNRNLDFGGKAIMVRSASDDPYQCVIDCEQDGRGFYFHGGETADSILQGLMIANGNVADDGGGVLCQFPADPTLINCVITANRAPHGCGLYCDGSSPTLVKCAISANYGGGVACSECSPTLINCTILDNDGYGIYCWKGGATLLNCTISGNGTGVSAWYGGPRLTNCTISGNGLGVYTFEGSIVRLANSIIWGNGQGIQTGEIEGGTAVATYCDIQGGWPGEQNIDADPGFAFANDFHLLPGSPCLDSGTNTPEGGLPALDIEGQSRPLDGDGDSVAMADMGAYEFNAAAPAIAVSPAELTFLLLTGQSASQTVDIRNASLGILAWQLQCSADWLSAVPGAGQSTGETNSVTVTVDTQDLALGRHCAVLTVIDPLASNSPRRVRVVLWVSNTLQVPESYPNIQAAIGAATPGCEIVLADGVYTGPGNRDIDFHGKPIKVRSASGNPAACVIDCQQAGRGFYFHTDESAATVVQDLTIRNGLAENGGAVYCDNTSPTLTNCTISGSTAARGGGVYCYASTATLINCTITGNTAAAGGGAYFDYSGLVLINCAVVGNSASVSGAGLHCRYCNLALTNCTITANAGASIGGGLYCDGLTPRLTNCILWADTPEEIYVASGTPAVTYCDVQGGWTGEGNIDLDPLFGLPGDPHLLPESPCLDAGANSPPGGLPTDDLDGQPRLIDGDGDGEIVVDMGACEFSPAAPAIAVSPADVILMLPAGQSSSPTLSIRNSGLGILSWELNWEADWLSADVTAGQSSGETDLVTLTIDTQSLAHARYDAVIWVTDPLASNSPRPVRVTLFVNSALSVPVAYPTIQAAINAAIPGDEVLVADGVYTGAGNRALDFAGKAITVRSASGDPATCVIDCGTADRGFYLHLGETAAAVVRGFTIRNGYASFGAGLYCNCSSPTVMDCEITDCTASSSGGGVGSSSSSVALINCLIANNAAASQGGGISCSSRPRITNCTIRNNTAAAGGGITCSFDSSATLTDCTISGNTAGSEGGGVKCVYASLTLSGCVITGNSGVSVWGGGVYFYTSNATLTECSISGNQGRDGGGIYCTWNSNLMLTNCVIAGNAATRYGGGICCYSSSLGTLSSSRLTSVCTLNNCTLSRNTASTRGGGLYVAAATVTGANSILWADTPHEIWPYPSGANLTYCDIQGGWTGTGNINADPLFVDAAGGDYRLTGLSPCVDAGDPAFDGAGQRELDGLARVWDGNDDGAARVDMGAYEFGSFRCGDLNCDGALNAFDIDPFVLALTDPAGYAAAFPGCSAALADANGDGAVNAFDIDPFVALLVGGV